ncbi:MAG TPA: hypothetical protein VFX37_12395 [Pseudolabrys sp.]|nr:hypothetical protein [Pseudolabrys sp.]
MTMLANQKAFRRQRPWTVTATLLRAAAFSILALLLALVATAGARYFDTAPQPEAAQLLLGP